MYVCIVERFHENLPCYLILFNNRHYLIPSTQTMTQVACFACKLPLRLAGAEFGRGILTITIAVTATTVNITTSFCYHLTTFAYSYHPGQAPSPAAPPPNSIHANGYKPRRPPRR